MTTTTDDLVDLVVAALRAANIAAGNVWSYRDWLRRRADLELVIVGLPQEDRTSLGRQGGAQFLVVATVPIIGRVTIPASADDMDALELQAKLAVLKREVEVAVVNEYELTRRIQQIPFIRAEPRISDKGEQLVGEIQISLGLEFYQGPEDFHLPDADDLVEVDITAVGHPAGGVRIDLTD